MSIADFSIGISVRISVRISMGFVGILTNSLRVSRDSLGFLWDSELLGDFMGSSWDFQ